MNKNTIFEKALITVLSVAVINHTASAKLVSLDNKSLASISGQVLFTSNYIPPNANGNLSNLGFFSLGMPADIELNTNIKRLQLGCGGVNGAGGCDIDLSDVRITGSKPGPSGTYADSDAILHNPYFQFAIKNPDSASTREIVGFMFGSETADLLLSIGQNPNPKVAGHAGGQTGVNTLSGSFETMVQNLKNPVVFAAAPGGIAPYAWGNGYLAATSTQPALSTTLMTQEASNNAKTGAYYQFVSGQRMTGVTFGPFSAYLPTFYLAGLNIGPINTKVVYEPLNFIDAHNLQIGSNPDSGFTISLNNQAILWPQIGSKGVFTFPNTNQAIDANGNLLTRGYNSNGTSISASQLMAQRGWWLSAPQSTIGDGSGFTTTSTSYPSPTDFVIAQTTGLLHLQSVNSGQIPVRNCFGGLTFC